MALDKLFGIGIKFSLIDKLTKASRGIVKSLNNVEKHAERADKVMGMAKKNWSRGWKMGLTGAAMTAPFVMIGKSLIEVNSEVERFEAQLTTALKSTEKARKMLDWATITAAKTPFELNEVIDATTRLEMYGLSAKKWFPLTGDMAGAMNKGVVQAVEAVADAISGGGLERLKEFGVTSQMLKAVGWSGTYQTAEGIYTLKKALESVMVGKFEGGMERLAATFTGKLSNMMDFIFRFKQISGKSLFEYSKTKLSELLLWLSKLEETGSLKKWAEIIGDSFIKAVQLLENVGKAIFTTVIPIIKFLEAHPALAKTIGMLSILSGAIVAIVGVLFSVAGGIGFLVANALQLLPLIKSIGFAFFALKFFAITALGPIIATAGPVVLAIAAIAGIAYLLYRNWETVSRALRKVWEAIVTGFKWLINLIISYYKWLWGFVSSLPGRFYDAGKKIILNMVAGIKSVIMVPYNTVKEGLQKLRDLLPFSPAKEGPLKDIDKSGRAFGDTFAAGILRSVAGVRDATMTLAAAGMIYGPAWSPTAISPADITAAQTSPLIKEWRTKKPAGTTGVGGITDLSSDLDLGGGFGGGGSSVTNNYYTIHVEQGAVVTEMGESLGDDFDDRVENALENLLKKAGIGS